MWSRENVLLTATIFDKFPLLDFDIFNFKFTLDGTIFYNIILYNTTDPSQHVDKTEVNNTFIYIPYDQISGSKNKFEMSLYKNYQYVVGEKKEVYDTLIYINDNIVSTTSDQSFEITQSKTMFPKNDIHASEKYRRALMGEMISKAFSQASEIINK